MKLYISSDGTPQPVHDAPAHERNQIYDIPDDLVARHKASVIEYKAAMELILAIVERVNLSEWIADEAKKAEIKGAGVIDRGPA
jgi:coenzyme F420-reducing hydrogenase alpha subunit